MSGNRQHIAPGQHRRRGSPRAAGEQPMVPRAEFSSYYGKPVIKRPVWEAPDIAGYLFLGGLAGTSSLLAAGAQLTGRDGLARAAKSGALAGAGLSIVALVHDLGRPARFVNMLRTFKVTSPMSVGSWLLSGYVPAAAVACGTALAGRLPRVGAWATAASALLGPAVASYTAALISDTAVPAWHDGYREMPFVFVGSAATAAGGLGMLAAPDAETTPARNLALLGVGTELVAAKLMEDRLGMVAEPYQAGVSGRFMKAGQVLAALGVAGTVAGICIAGPRGKVARRLAGAAFVAASAATRWGIFHAGKASADDPKYTVIPQRQRLDAS
ncbi:MAG TPA: NrfD/PsrC family molybdoenzyme membrane anchor subunit [Streptosporangiaceae bacterium]|nr:NrfD/PsrC family molybdoenzyme membrane anchor subunit [Streptosporangiaceae bacterium]